jgi:flagellar transcriptional activator FlhC
LLRLYKEVAGKSPSKGPTAVFHRLVSDLAAQYPCFAVSQHLRVPEQGQRAGRHRCNHEGLPLYNEQIATCGVEPLLSITRAWRLVKFVDNHMLAMTKCSKCGGHFVSEPYENCAAF